MSLIFTNRAYFAHILLDVFDGLLLILIIWNPILSQNIQNLIVEFHRCCVLSNLFDKTFIKALYILPHFIKKELGPLLNQRPKDMTDFINNAQ